MLSHQDPVFLTHTHDLLIQLSAESTIAFLQMVYWCHSSLWCLSLSVHFQLPACSSSICEFTFTLSWSCTTGKKTSEFVKLNTWAPAAVPSGVTVLYDQLLLCFASCTQDEAQPAGDTSANERTRCLFCHHRRQMRDTAGPPQTRDEESVSRALQLFRSLVLASKAT